MALALCSRYQFVPPSVPGSSAVAAITLDKVIEMLSNFAFLSVGLALVVGVAISLRS